MTTLSTAEKREIQRSPELVVLTLGFPRRIRLTDPKTMAKNDKYFADMAIKSQCPLTLILFICPGLITFFCIFVFYVLTALV